MNAEARAFISDMMSGTPNVKLYDLNSDKWVCQNRRRLYWTNIPFNPDDVHTTHPLHLKELIGDEYERACMLKHSSLWKTEDRYKIVPDRRMACTITKSVYFKNNGVRFKNNGILQTYTKV